MTRSICFTRSIHLAAAGLAALAAIGLATVQDTAQAKTQTKAQAKTHAAPQAKAVHYQLPDETSAFKPGPNRDAAVNNCAACHSADYIQTQPRGPKFTHDFWQAEVTKMIKVYGAPIDDADVAKIVDYLTATY